MASEERETKPARVRGVERSFEVQIGSLGGFDLRPTRFFVWAGEEREGRERVVPLDSPPRNLKIPRRERHVEVGLVRARTLGNPLMTIALAGVHAAKKVSAERRRRELERFPDKEEPRL
ncbi:MAG: hypothetical protein ACR2L0_09715 [Gaiellaceae bacterium]